MVAETALIIGGVVSWGMLYGTVLAWISGMRMPVECASGSGVGCPVWRNNLREPELDHLQRHAHVHRDGGGQRPE